MKREITENKEDKHESTFSFHGLWGGCGPLGTQSTDTLFIGTLLTFQIIAFLSFTFI